MDVEITISEADIRTAVCAFLKQRYPAEVTNYFGDSKFEIRTTYRSNETWRTPKYLRLRVTKKVPLCG